MQAIFWHRCSVSPLVMAGLDPAIHVFLFRRSKDVDARDKPGHDAFNSVVQATVPEARNFLIAASS